MGVDLEHNPLSEHNLDVLPSGRLMWTLNAENHIWTAVTKAISTPSYEDTGASVRNAAPVVPPGAAENPFPVPIVTSVQSNPGIRSERLVAYEVGYRTQIDHNVSIDATVYRHDYEDLRDAAPVGLACEPSLIQVSVNPGCVLGAADVVQQIQFQNDLRGHSSGFELATDWVPTGRVRLRAVYTYLRMSLEPTLAGPVPAGDAVQAEGQSPKNQLSARADLTLSQSVDLDLAVRHVDALPTIPVPQYWSADANLVWHAMPKLEFSLVGRNLLQKAHVEFISELADVVPTQIERTVAAKIRWTF
jgi:iron complex outermembrane receptor protein